MLYFLATKLLLQPYSCLLLLLGAGLVAVIRKGAIGRRRRAAAVVPFGLLVVLSTPAAVYPLSRLLERPFPPVEVRPADAGAVVVLGGGILEADAVRRRPELTEDTLSRCLRGAELYHAGKPCPVIVSGGLDPASGTPVVAPAMRDMLVRLGVDPADVVVEANSRTTFENAVECRKVLQRLGVRKAVVATEAYHMYRSIGCFRKLGVDVVPAACNHRSTVFKWTPGFFLPTPGALRDLTAVVHEWFGIAWYRARGRI